MKKLLTIAASLFAAVAFAQSVTNLSFRVTVEVVTAGVTNSSVANLRLDRVNNKENLLTDGALDAFTKYRVAGGVLALDAWLRQDVRDRLMEYAKAKFQADNAALIAKITQLLTSQTDLLTVGDLNNLTTIGAKAQ